jgi:hypothetical protein
MRSSIIFTVILLTGFLTSCKKDDPIPGGGGGNPVNPGPVPTFISSTEMDADGGTISHDMFDFIISEDALNGAFTISLEKYSPNVFFGSDEATVFYRINGLPLELHAPVTFSFSLEADQPLYAVIGEETKAISQEAESINFRFCDVIQSDNNYSLTIENTDIPNYSTDDTISLIIGLVKNYTVLNTKGNFKIYTPSVYIDDALNLEQYLEEAYAKFLGTSFNFSYALRTSWPVSVSVKKLESGTYGYFIPSKWGNNYGSLSFNSDYISNSTEMRLTAGHEYFHLVQALYDPRYGFTKAILPSNYYWVEEAASVFSESYFTSNMDYISPIRNGHQMAPFNGFLAGAEESAQEHGYGMSSIVKYLAQNFGTDKLVKVFENELSGSSDIVSGFNNAFGITLSDVYDDFLGEYILGNVYNDFGASNLLGGVDGTFSINSAGDTAKSFEATYPALSAKVYKIDVNYSGLTGQSSLLLQSNGMKKLIFKIQGSDVSFLGNYGADYTLINLSEIQQQNALILVVMVSTYYSENNGKLDIKVTSAQPLSFDGFKFKITDLTVLDNLYSSATDSTTESEVNYDYTFDYGTMDEYIDGTFSGNTFSADWNVPDSWVHIGNAQIVIDQQAQKIVSGSIEAGIESQNNPEDNYDRMEITFSDVSATYWGDNYVIFAVNGEDFCNSAFVSHFYETSNNAGYFIRTMISYSCLANTQFVVQFRVAQ